MMIALRLFSIILVILALTGCAEYKKRSLAAKLLDIKPVCEPPSFVANDHCRYMLKVTSIKGNTARAKIAMEAVATNQKGCQELIREEVYPPDYKRPDPNKYPDHEYEIQIDPETPVPGPGTYEFETERGKSVLKLVTSVSPVEKAQ